MNIQTSIIIVFHSGFRNLINLLHSIKDSRNMNTYEVIVVDNSTIRNVKSAIIKIFKDVKYIKSKNNGYGAGNNLGSKLAIGRYLFILNPDTKIFNGTIDTLVKFLENNSDAAIVAPNLIDNNGYVFSQLGTSSLTPLKAIFALSFINKYFPNNKISREYWLKNLDKKNIREADSVPGSAFMMKKDIFKKVGGFDENIFMFFEESDLGKRTKEAGYKLFITPKSQVMHRWKEATGTSSLQKHFNYSRHYYFKKYYGSLKATIVEKFLNIDRWNILLLLSLAFGFYIRFYRAIELFNFEGEIGDNLLDIKYFIINSYIPLIGPPTSHTWLHFGPLFYWIYGPILAFYKYNPLSHLYFGLFISSMLMVINFIYIKKIFNRHIAIISTSLISVSPIFIAFGRAGRFYSITALFFYPLLYFLTRKKRKRDTFIIFFIIGTALNFHYTPLIYLPAVFIYMYRNKILNVSHILKSLPGIFIPLSPLIIYDAINNRAKMLISLFIWVPYRLLGAINIIPKNNLTPESFPEVLRSITSFFIYSFYTPLNDYNSLFLLFVLLILITALFVGFKYVKNNSVYYSILIFSTGIFFLILHAEIPLHYFIPIISLPILLITLIIYKIKSTKIGRILIYPILLVYVILMFISNILRSNNMLNSNNYIDYNELTGVAKSIVENAHGNKFSLTRNGKYDDFEKDFAQNYIYLLWYYGNEPVDDGKILYKIYEGEEYFPSKTDDIIYRSDRIIVDKIYE